MKAIHIASRSNAVIVDKPIPPLRDGYMLVKPKAVALQPSDWKHVDFMLVGDPTGVRLGFEYAGDVVDVGNMACAASHTFEKGDRVFGLCHATNVFSKEDGTFAEYALVRPEFQMKIPAHLTYNEASAIASGLIPVCQGLYQDLGLPLPTCPSPRQKTILIYGGSTASGMMGIQFASLSNYRVLTTCSPQNAALLRSLGADAVVDYRSETCIQDLKDALGRSPLRCAWDCVATAQSARICAEVLSPKGGHYSSLLMLSSTILRRVNPKIRCSTTLGYTVFGEKFSKETVVQVRAEDHRCWLAFWKMCETLLLEQKFKPPPLLVNVGGQGLPGVMHGLGFLKQGKVSAAKLVYSLPDVSSDSEGLPENCCPVDSSVKPKQPPKEPQTAEQQAPIFPSSLLISCFQQTKHIMDDRIVQSGFAGYFNAVHPCHVQLCVALIIEALRKLRCDLGQAHPGQPVRKVKETTTGAAKNQLDYCYRLLCNVGLLRMSSPSAADRVQHFFVRTDTPVSVRTSEQILHDLVRDYPAVESVSRLIHHVGSHLAEIWSGRTNAVHVIFGTPLGKTLIKDVYGIDQTSQAFHRVLEHFLERILTTGLETKSHLRLLEVGAGTGGTTKWLAPLLDRLVVQSPKWSHAEYTFTDLAPGLVSQAAQTFAGFPFMTYLVYDMETVAPPDMRGTQDIIVAVNAVHAASDMRQALKNLRDFLRPAGFCLVLEIQEAVCWADFVFGLFEGWWRFNDGRTHAIAGPEQWRNAFIDAGFAHVDWTEGNLVDSNLQRLFLATN